MRKKRRKTKPCVTTTLTGQVGIKSQQTLLRRTGQGGGVKEGRVLASQSPKKNRFHKGRSSAPESSAAKNWKNLVPELEESVGLSGMGVTQDLNEGCVLE